MNDDVSAVSSPVKLVSSSFVTFLPLTPGDSGPLASFIARPSLQVKGANDRQYPKQNLQTTTNDNDKKLQFKSEVVEFEVHIVS
eukprot:m.187167 g.187167  ORF g.187167 m.187167 type:complete len:84 (+) comp14769_c2_seq1:1458-1709(+)